MRRPQSSDKSVRSQNARCYGGLNPSAASAIAAERLSPWAVPAGPSLCRTCEKIRLSRGQFGLEADLWAHPKLRYADNLRRAHARQPHLQPADVAAEVLRGRSAEWLDELFVAGVERVHVLDVIAA